MQKLLTATALAAMLTAGVATAMQTETARSPGAPLTKAQLLSRADARFDAMDTNKDGKLSAQEREATRSEGRHGGRAAAMLTRVDTNKDGLISRAEHRAAAEVRFARIDANKDGTIEAGERPGFREKRGGKRLGMRGHRMAMMADANRDGAISRTEYDAAAAQRFARLDTNRDGKLDRNDRPQHRITPPAPVPAPGT